MFVSPGFCIRRCWLAVIGFRQTPPLKNGRIREPVMFLPHPTKFDRNNCSTFFLGLLELEIYHADDGHRRRGGYGGLSWALMLIGSVDASTRGVEDLKEKRGVEHGSDSTGDKRRRRGGHL